MEEFDRRRFQLLRALLCAALWPNVMLLSLGHEASLLGSDSVYQVSDTDTCAVFVSCMHFTLDFAHTNMIKHVWLYDVHKWAYVPGTFTVALLVGWHGLHCTVFATMLHQFWRDQRLQILMQSFSQEFKLKGTRVDNATNMRKVNWSTSETDSMKWITMVNQWNRYSSEAWIVNGPGTREHFSRMVLLSSCCHVMDNHFSAFSASMLTSGKTMAPFLLLGVWVGMSAHFHFEDSIGRSGSFSP